MALVLTNGEVATIAAAARTLLTSSHASVDLWRADVLEKLTALVGADAGGFLLPLPQGSPYTLHNIPDAFAREYIETFHPIDESTGLLETLGGGVWSTRLLLALRGASGEEGLRDSPVYNEFYVRYHLRDAIGFAVLGGARPTPGLDAPPHNPPVAMLTCFRQSFGSDGFGERGMAILSLLQPALEAGIAARARNGGVGGLEAGLDSVRDGVLLCDGEGRRIHANVALSTLLLDDPERQRIEAALLRVRSRVASLLAGRLEAEALGELEGVSVEVRTALARYAVSASLAEPAMPGARPTIVLSVHRLSPNPPSLALLREWWGLSHQEARVALLIARGMSNARVAASMRLSPATVRHYTESVFLKLGVTSRAEATSAILSR